MVPISLSLSGLAASIRGSTESTTFDCANITALSLRNSMISSLSSPLPISNMIRLTFIVGAGKLNRSRYDDTLLRTVCHTLQSNLDYAEDRGADCTYDSSGTYKIQHDTGKNIKTVLVFPYITGPKTNGAHSNEITSKLQDKSAGKILLQMSMEDFFETIELMSPTWIQKKRCHLELLDEQLKYSIIQTKLILGQRLTDYQQNVYNTVLNMDEKLTFLKSKLQNHITEKQLTAIDKQYILQQMEKRKQELQEKLNKQSNCHTQQLQKKINCLNKRRKNLIVISPVMFPPLRYEAKLETLHIQLIPFIKLEKKIKGRLATVQETTQLSKKDGLEEEIKRWEINSLGWYEEHEEFQQRLQESRRRLTHCKQQLREMITENTKKTLTKSKEWNQIIHLFRTKSKSTSEDKPFMNTFQAMMIDSDSD